MSVKWSSFSPDLHQDYNPQPKAKRFSRKTNLPVNRQTYSQAAVTASQMQDYSFCTIFGEETREYPLLYASVFQFVIPNTGIILYISKGLIVRVNGSIKLEGVMPDISISNQLLDEIVNPLLKLL